MKRILKLLLVVLFALPLGLHAQKSTCTDLMKMRKPVQPYVYYNSSKSAMCQTGRKYELVLPITKGSDYRIQFFASPVFNNNIDVKIIDMSTGETVVNVPGKLTDGEEPKNAQQTAFQAFLDPKKNALVHPFFDFTPVSSTSLKIILDVKNVEVHKETVSEYSYSQDEYDQQPQPKPQPSSNDESIDEPVEIYKGCITVYVIHKETDEDSF